MQQTNTCSKNCIACHVVVMGLEPAIEKK